MVVIVQHLSVFLSPLRDEALDVRRAGLLTLNAVIHHDVDVVKPLLAQDNQVDAESKVQEQRSEAPMRAERGGALTSVILFVGPSGERHNRSDGCTVL